MSLDKVLKSFRKTIKQLDQFIDEQNKTVQVNEESIQALANENDRREREADRASSICEKLAFLVDEE